MTTDGPERKAPEPAVRLVFEYEGDQVNLVSQKAVDVVIDDDAHPEQGHPGFYVDSRSTADLPLARVRTNTAFTRSAEVFPRRPGEPFERVERPNRGAFTVLLPMPEGAHHVTLVQVGAAPPALTPSPSPLPGVARLASRSFISAEGPRTATDLATFVLSPDK